MKTFTLTLALLLTLSLIFTIDANPRYSNEGLREQLLDYLAEVRREELLYNQRKRLQDQIRRWREKFSDDDESSDSNDYGKTIFRRKAVGLGDNPYK